MMTYTEPQPARLGMPNGIIHTDKVAIFRCDCIFERSSDSATTQMSAILAIGDGSDVDCDECTLQLIQVRYDAPPYTVGPDSTDMHYQCADIVLVSDWIFASGFE